MFPFTPDLERLLRAQQALTDALKPTKGIISFVFHRYGRRITKFPKTWRDACAAAGCPGRIPHDLRRTAVRNLVRAGVSETVAMKLTGHKTRSVFERYNIVSDGDLREAVAKLAARHGTILGQSARIAVNDDDRNRSNLLRKVWRRRPDLNRGWRFCRPLPYLLATAPRKRRMAGLATRPDRTWREENVGAGNGIRTRDFDLGKVALYH